MSKKIKVAVTGGIGAGKSTFCRFLSEMNYPVINADRIAKEILLTDTGVKQKIIKIFGENSYTSDGINTAYLAEKVFSDEEKVKKINSIVHPPTIKKINYLISESLEKTTIVFVEAALIYEAEMEDLFDYVVLISADEEVRINRIIERENVTEEEIRERMENQLPEKTKRELADFVFDNNDSIEDLKIKSKILISILKSISGEV